MNSLWNCQRLADELEQKIIELGSDTVAAFVAETVVGHPDHRQGTARGLSADRREAFARGLMVYAMGGTVDGKIGDHVLLAPPFICTASDIDEIVSRLADAIDAALVAALAVAPVAR